jgi:hypothetical protein
MANRFTFSIAPNWDAPFVPVPALTNINRGYGVVTPSVSNIEREIPGGSAVLRGKTRVLARLSDLGWNDADVIFLRVTAQFPTLPSETGPILLLLVPDQYRLWNGSLVLSGVAAGLFEIRLPRLCCDAVVNVSAGTLDIQFGTGPGFVTVTPVSIYTHPRAQFSTLTLSGGATFSISMALNVPT